MIDWVPSILKLLLTKLKYLEDRKDSSPTCRKYLQNVHLTNVFNPDYINILTVQ